MPNGLACKPRYRHTRAHTLAHVWRAHRASTACLLPPPPPHGTQPFGGHQSLGVPGRSPHRAALFNLTHSRHSEPQGPRVLIAPQVHGTTERPCQGGRGLILADLPSPSPRPHPQRREVALNSPSAAREPTGQVPPLSVLRFLPNVGYNHANIGESEGGCSRAGAPPPPRSSRAHLSGWR